MTDNRIILPGQIAPGAPRGLLLPNHVVEEREAEREAKQLRSARLAMMQKAQDQLEERSFSGRKETPEDQKEIQWLLRVANPEMSRKQLRAEQRRMNLFPNQRVRSHASRSMKPARKRRFR